MEEQILEENQNNQNNQNKKKRAFYSFLEIIKIIFLAALIVLPIRYFLFQPFIVRGESMMPNFQTGNYLIVDEISYRFSSPQRGDVIVFKYPYDTKQRFIKRLIGLPGETIEVKDGKISISKGEEKIPLNEKQYLPDLGDTKGSVKIDLKQNEYFVMGDNRDHSYDSRFWGVLSSKYIIGKALLRLFPINELDKVNTPTY